MIEVEKKFILTKKQEKRLTEEAKFLGEKKFTDTYYDDLDFSLTIRDIWFRDRDRKFELKLPMNFSIEERISDQYEELENDKDILKYFNADINKTLNDFLTEKEYKPFCKITTIRKKYKKEGFNIDLDSTDFGYTNAEIEYMTDDVSKMEEITKSIIEFAKRHNMVSHGNIWGKVIEYVRRNNPKHFQALIDAKVIK